MGGRGGLDERAELGCLAQPLVRQGLPGAPTQTWNSGSRRLKQCGQPPLSSQAGVQAAPTSSRTPNGSHTQSQGVLCGAQCKVTVRGLCSKTTKLKDGDGRAENQALALLSVGPRACPGCTPRSPRAPPPVRYGYMQSTPRRARTHCPLNAHSAP